MEDSYRPSRMADSSHWNIPPSDRLQFRTSAILHNKPDPIFDGDNSRWGTSSGYRMVDGRKRRENSPKNKCKDACDLLTHTPRSRNYHRRSPIPSLPRLPSWLTNGSLASNHLESFVKSY